MNEPGVFGEAAGIQVERNAVAGAHGLDGFDVRHGDGLAAAGIIGDRQHHEGDLRRTFGGDQGFERGDVHVALEIQPRLRIVRFRDGQIDGARAGEFHVGAGGIEVRVVGDDVPGLAHHGKENALGGASLVGGDHVAKAGECVGNSLEAEEALAAGVALVAAHDGGPLLRGHRAGAGIGEQVDQDMAGVDQEEVVAGFGEVALALRRSGVVQRFHALDAEGFDDGAHEPIIATGGGYCSMVIWTRLLSTPSAVM